MLHPSRRVLLALAGAGLLLFVVFSWVVSAHLLDDSDLRLNAWVERHVGSTILGVPWSTLTSIGAGTMATAAVGAGAFLAWRAGAGRTALIIVVVAIMGGILVDGFKSAYARPYPPHDSYAFSAGNGTQDFCPPQARCNSDADGNITIYCPEGARCNFYFDQEFRNGTLEDKRAANGTYVAANLDTFPTRPGRAYPSGHTMGATLSWGLALILGTRAVQGRCRLDGWAVGIWAAVAFVGGVSRVPVHSHWWTDVVGSWLLGGALLALAIALDDALQKPSPPEAESDNAA